jgi:hypothetical protein
MAMRPEISREGVMEHRKREEIGRVCRKMRAYPSETNRTGRTFHRLASPIENAKGQTS